MLHINRSAFTITGRHSTSLSPSEKNGSSHSSHVADLVYHHTSNAYIWPEVRSEMSRGARQKENSTGLLRCRSSFNFPGRVLELQFLFPGITIEKIRPGRYMKCTVEDTPQETQLAEPVVDTGDSTGCSSKSTTNDCWAGAGVITKHRVVAAGGWDDARNGVDYLVVLVNGVEIRRGFSYCANCESEWTAFGTTHAAQFPECCIECYRDTSFTSIVPACGEH